MGLIELGLMAGAIVAVYYVVIWSIRNDKVESIDQQSGAIRMRPPVEADDRAPGGHSGRTGPRRRQPRAAGPAARAVRRRR